MFSYLPFNPDPLRIDGYIEPTLGCSKDDRGEDNRPKSSHSAETCDGRDISRN